MAQIRDRIILKIETIAFGGAGVGRVDGLVVFVPFTAPGDLAEVEIIEKKKRFARGRLLSLPEPSSRRTEALCRYYGRCGGCCYQHIAYDAQLRIKYQQVVEAFVKIGGISEPPVRDVIPSPWPFAYRGKADLHAAKTGSGWHFGFMDTTGGRLLDIDRCEIMHETVNDRIRELRTGGLWHGQGDDLKLWSGSDHPALESVVRTVKGRELLVPRTGFFQANLYLTDTMVDETIRLVSGKKVDLIVDACCGSGLFSVYLAPYAHRLIGIEIHEKSVKYARLNAERYGVGNAEFICGDIEDVLCDMQSRGDPMDILLLDPPRAGLSQKSLAIVSASKAFEIIYISCNPATQARDIRQLTAGGYRLESVQPLDMFPQTEHVETVARLTAEK